MYTQTMTAVYNSLKKKGFSDEDFDKWLLNPNIRKLYPQAALDVISTMWYSEVLKPKPKPKKKKPMISVCVCQDDGICQCDTELKKLVFESEIKAEREATQFQLRGTNHQTGTGTAEGAGGR